MVYCRYLMKKSSDFSVKAIFTITFFITMTGMVLASPDQPSGYSRLMELIMLDDMAEPLYPFNDFKAELDTASHGEYLTYLNEQPDVLKKIYTGLGSEKIQWKLDNISNRLLYVPEMREEYATLYESYCNDVVTYVLDKTKLKNPYRSIQTLLYEKPDISDDDKGIVAFLVHNIIEESSATYIFSNPEGKKLKVELNERTFSGAVGSYGTDIYIRENGEFEFISNKYTIWQNSAKNPYTALLVPAEETLHIVLRKYTERVIKETLKENSIRTLKEVEEIVDNWIAVEEAIVGGLVYTLIPEMIDQYLDQQTQDLVEADLQRKRKFKRYHHLRKGIGIVGRIGYAESIKLYKEDPNRFKALLLS